MHSKSMESHSYDESINSKAANGRLACKQAVANGVKCAYKRYQQMRSISFNKHDLSRLKELKVGGGQKWMCKDRGMEKY